MIKDIIDEVYREAVSLEYPMTDDRWNAIKELGLYVQLETVYDLCPQGQEVSELYKNVIPLVPDKDMHLFLDELEPLNADMIVVRHVLEHSIMPFVLLKLLQKHTKKILLVYPEHTKEMIEYDNHYSVMSEDALFHLLNKSGWKAERLFAQIFNGNGYIETGYLITRKGK